MKKPEELLPQLAPPHRDPMQRREFLYLGATAALATTLEPLSALAQTTVDPHENWSGTVHFHTDRILQPGSPADVQRSVRTVDKLRAVGTRHSFNAIADSYSAQISSLQLKGIELQPDNHAVRVGAGVRLGELAAEIDRQGWALANLPSLPHISVGGCISTATHGSGVKNQNLSAAVRAIEFVGADGELHTLTRGVDPAFAGAVVALGCLGVLTRVTLDVQPRYEVAQAVYENLSFDQLASHLHEIMGAAYSVSLFTHWDKHRAEQVWLKHRLANGEKPVTAPAFFGATLADRKLHPAGREMDATPCTEQGNVPGPWFERLPHFKLAFTPSSGHEIQTEYFVPLERGYEAIRAVEALHARITPHLIVTEIRTIAADDLWMSMAYKRPSLAIHFTWKPEAEAVLAVLPSIEQALAPFGARPHWAKVFTLQAATLANRYPQFAAFQKLVQQHDPNGKFRNAFTQEKLNL